MSLPYFPLYPTDFEADTSHLTMAEDGAYNRLLRLCWMMPGCSLPADDAWILRRMRVRTDDEREAVLSVLAEFFIVQEGSYSNARLSRIWHDANEAHERRKNAGSKGGRAKALKENDAHPSNARAKLKQPEPEPEPYIREEPKGSLSPAGDPKPFDEVACAVSAYNDAADASGWPKVQVLSKSRRAALQARLRECGGVAGWAEALARARASPHLCGQNDRGWRANFDFLTRQSSFAKLMEGNYDPASRNVHGKSNPGANPASRAIHDALRMGAAQRFGDGGG